MRLFDWLFRRPSRSKREVTHATQPPALTPAEVRAPTLDAASVEMGEFECLIEYQASDGDTTRRRITMQSCIDAPNGPRIEAYCHERAAARTFVVSRIRCIIDADGVIHNPREFLHANFGISFGGIDQPAKTLEDVTICFTGRLDSMTRREAEALAQKHGATVKTHTEWTPYKGRNMLVVGAAPGAKVERAVDRGIEVISETDFLLLIGSQTGHQS